MENNSMTVFCLISKEMISTKATLGNRQNVKTTSNIFMKKIAETVNVRSKYQWCKKGEKSTKSTKNNKLKCCLETKK